MDNNVKLILDMTCGSKTIWFNKNHPSVVYCDKRYEQYASIWKSGNGKSERFCTIKPDVVCDFTNLPFDDNTFNLVVFDPPHLVKAGETSWLVKKYGRLVRGGRTCCTTVLQKGCAYLNRTACLCSNGMSGISLPKGCGKLSAGNRFLDTTAESGP